MSAQDDKPAVLVTGGSRGIGSAICRHLLDSGYRCISFARGEHEISDPDLVPVKADLGDLEALRAAAAPHANQPIYGLVHNAGLIRPALLEEATTADLEHLTRVHLGAALVLAQIALPRMRERGIGRIVLIGSRGALGLQTRTNYAATKAGMQGQARTWALELGPSGITANVIAPGPIVTDMFHEIVPEGDPRIDSMAAGLPVGRLGTPEDVANAVDFLMKPESGFITGQTLYVCGGASVGSLQL